MEETLKYDEKVSTMPLAERITETINLLINQQFGEEKELSLTLQELRKTIPKAMKVARMVSTHESMLRTALMKDLFREMREHKGNISQILTQLKDFAETVTKEYIVAEIEKAKRTGCTAA